jgi:2'-5' RNA ligase
VVPSPLRERLLQVRRACGDPQAEAFPPHITVIPPTAVSRSALPAMLDRIETRIGQCGPFNVRLRGAGTFRPVTPVVFAKLVEGAGACAALESQVREAIGHPEGRFPYEPHVTVAQDATDAVLDQAENAIGDLDEGFAVDALEVCLLQPDAVWQPLRRFPLAPSGRGQASAESGPEESK